MTVVSANGGQLTNWRIMLMVLRKQYEERPGERNSRAAAPFAVRFADAVGPVLIVFGRSGNIPDDKRRGNPGRSLVGKGFLVGAKVLEHTDKVRLRGFVDDMVPGIIVYTDDTTEYRGMARRGVSAKHSIGGQGRGQTAWLHGHYWCWELPQCFLVAIFLLWMIV